MKSELKDLIALMARRPLLSKIHPYKDIHKGESCYVMGDGVSVKWFDLSAFSDKIAIVCNFFVFHKQFEELNAPYAVLPEPFWFYPRQWTSDHPRKNISNPISKFYKQEIIDRYVEKTFFLNLSNCLTVRRKNVVYTFNELWDERLPENFITKRIDCFAGSLRVSIMMAIYMGFDHVFLVGHDYTHSPSRSSHWYEKGEGVFHPQKDFNKEFFEIAKEFIDITTITLDGTSDFLDAISYKKHTGQNPIYRDHTDLADENCLKILSTWPGYNI